MAFGRIDIPGLASGAGAGAGAGAAAGFLAGGWAAGFAGALLAGGDPRPGGVSDTCAAASVASNTTPARIAMVPEDFIVRAQVPYRFDVVRACSRTSSRSPGRCRQ